MLWKKVMPRLSAGRVQSVATRMVVERERARMAFRSATWWGVEGTFAPGAGAPPDPAAAGFAASLVALDGTALATGRDFTATGEQNANGERPGARRGRGHGPWPSGLAGPDRSPCARSPRSPFRRSPAPPFMTSTLQQEAGRKLRFSAQRAMQVAQRLYEQGWITYMRTDSTTLSDEALRRGPVPGRRPLRPRLRAPTQPRRYERKVKNAQEAHEAIRPAGDTLPHARGGRPARSTATSCGSTS